MGVTIKDNLPALADWVAAQKGGLIVLDGLPGAGKSTLARDLEASLDCLVVDADCFLVKERGKFIGALRVRISRGASDGAGPARSGASCEHLRSQGRRARRH